MGGRLREDPSKIAASSEAAFPERKPSEKIVLSRAIVARQVLAPFGARAKEREERPNMATGTVKWFNSQKGFGFIQPTDGSKDVFVHVSSVERAGLRTLNEGQQVTFEVSMERGKPAAVNLQVT